MKFLYEYRTPDNAKHNGVICVSDRETAYATLKKQGIKPSRLVEAPGLFNKIFGKGKRWIAIGVLAVALVASLVVYFSTMTDLAPRITVADAIDNTSRRQVIGDSAVIEMGIRNGWIGVFRHEGERFLASFAIPGVPAGQRSTSEKEIQAALSRTIEAEEGDGIEIRQIKAMVEGMKRELRQYLADGGTVVGYGRELVARQEKEIQYYSRAKAELDAAAKSGMSQAAVEELWSKRNGELRKMGIRLVPMPE